MSVAEDFAFDRFLKLKVTEIFDQSKKSCAKKFLEARGVRVVQLCLDRLVFKLVIQHTRLQHSELHVCHTLKSKVYFFEGYHGRSCCRCLDFVGEIDSTPGQCACPKKCGTRDHVLEV